MRTTEFADARSIRPPRQSREACLPGAFDARLPAVYARTRFRRIGHGQAGADIRNAAATRGGPRRSKRRERGAKEWAYRARDHAPDRRQQGRNRKNVSPVHRSLLRYVPGNIGMDGVRLTFYRLPKFSGSTLGSPSASEISTVDCPVSSNRLRHL